MDSNNKITDESEDRKYFTIAPRLVWALARTPYDFSLWCTVKDIAGESRECYLSTPDLAVLSMMSVGKAHECRDYLIEIGLLVGNVVKDPGYPQPVWHLRVPNIWANNIRWCEDHPSIKDRVEFKKKERSPGERLFDEERSPGEKGLVPGEKGLVPGETKNNQKEKNKEKPRVDFSSQEKPAEERESQSEEKEYVSEPETEKLPPLYGRGGQKTIYCEYEGHRTKIKYDRRMKETPCCGRPIIWDALEPQTPMALLLQNEHEYWKGFASADERKDWERMESSVSEKLFRDKINWAVNSQRISERYVVKSILTSVRRDAPPEPKVKPFVARKVESQHLEME